MSKVPTINPGPDDSDRMPQDATETLPIISAADTKQPQTSLDDSTDISDEEAYAKLKAKRAERRRKKLIRRGIAVGVVVAIALIAIIATLVINAQPAGTNGPVTDMVTEGTFTTTVEAKGQLKPISASVVSPSVDGTVEKINVQAGQSVNEGDVLMTIKNDALDSAVSEAQRARSRPPRKTSPTRRKPSLPRRPPQRRTSMQLPPQRQAPPLGPPTRTPYRPHSAASHQPRQTSIRRTPRPPGARLRRRARAASWSLTPRWAPR